MAKFLLLFAAVAVLSNTAAPRAQTPAQQELGASTSVNLTLEHRHIIKELVKELKIVPSKVVFQPALGEAIPREITPHAMPSEIAQKVPQIKTHTLIITEQQIVIVDSKDNKVAELIDLRAN